MRYVAEAGLPAVAMCVSTTYGSGDWGRTPHGAFIAGAVFGKLPFMMNGIQLEVVGVDDAARAMILAAERGRIGERYLISERMIPLKEVVRIAADEAGVPPPPRSISVPVLYALGALGSLKARLTGKDAELSLNSVRMMRAEADVDHSKAVRELGWQPRPVEESIREAARFWAAMRTAGEKQRKQRRRPIRISSPRWTAFVSTSTGRRRPCWRRCTPKRSTPMRPARSWATTTPRPPWRGSTTTGRQRLSMRGGLRRSRSAPPHFDNWTRQFLAAHEQAVVLHVGCGLDARVLPAGSGPGVLWYDIDYPEVIAAARTGIPRPDELSNAAGVRDRSVLAGRDTRPTVPPLPRRGPDHVPDQRRRAGAVASRRRSIPRQGNCSSTRSTPSGFGLR